MLPRIYVDFNTKMLDIDEPRRVVVAKVGHIDPDILPVLHPGARVLLFDEEIAVEAVLEYAIFPTGAYWLAHPDLTTLHDVE